MYEITSTRANEMIDPAMHIWGWEIPVYLFLGGLVAGIMVISGYFLFRERHKEPLSTCLFLPRIGIILLSLGMFALFLDLEHKPYFWRLYTTFQVTSPMSWGAWILLLVYPTLLANALVRPFHLLERLPGGWNGLADRIQSNPLAIKGIGVVNMLLGSALGVYTGILLSTLGARPLWNSSILGFLFLISGLSSAAALVHLLARDVWERELLAKADNGFLIIELVVIGLFLLGLLTATQAHHEAVQLILSGPFAPVFWVFVIGLGIVIPLIIQLLAVSHRIPHTAIAPILVVAGGVILRFVLVYAGQYSHWM